MLRQLGRLLRWWALWAAIGGFIVAAFAVWLVVPAVLRAQGAGNEDEVFQTTAQVMWVACGVAAGLTVAVTALVRRRARTRRWLPLWAQMRRAAAAEPSTRLVVVMTLPDPAAGGHVIAHDSASGERWPLWLPGHAFPPGAVVCFTPTPSGPIVRGWMSGRLWLACTRLAERKDRRVARRMTRVQQNQERDHEQAVREAERRAVEEAERILREHSPDA